MENSVSCKHCGSESYSKNGYRNGRQFYKCKDCGRCFLPEQCSKRSEAQKTLAVILYGSGKSSYRYLAKLFNVCPATIMNWIKAYADKIDITAVPNTIKEIEIDEMWHFIDLKKTNCGSLKPLIDLAEKQLHGLQVVETLKLSNASTKK